MDNEERRETMPPRRGRMGGPGMRGAPGEKAKDFSSSMKRLLKELKKQKILIVIALVLAMVASVVSVIAPDRLKDLTNEISKGLMVDKDNIQKVGENITKNIFSAVPPEVMAQINMASTGNVSPDATSEDIQKNQTSATPAASSAMPKLSAEMLEGFKALPIAEIDIDGSKISKEDQLKFLEVLSTIDMTNTENLDINALYSKLDELPDSIKSLIEPKMDMDWIKKATAILCAMYFISSLFHFIQNLLMTDVSNKFAKQLRSRISKKINLLPLRYYDKHTNGDILSRVTNDVDTIAQTMNQSLGTLATSGTLFLGSIIMMFYTNWILALTAMASSLIGFIGMGKILAKSQKYFVARQVELGKLNGHIEEVFSGLNVVKVYNGKKEADEKFDIYNKSVCESNRKSQFISGMMQPLMGFIGNFGYVMVCIVGAVLAAKDIITFGVIVAFITYVRLFTNPLSQIAQAMTNLQSTAAAGERVFEFIDETEMPDQSSITKVLEKDKVKGHIEFENVVFQYDNNDKPTIKNFTATAKPGQKIAIVGPTGAGKTTMVNLLMKFYDINSGDIRIDGVSTKELKRENIHELFTMVLQDTWLFDGTIKENIIYNREHVTDAQVEKVCEEVGISHFIKTLPHGYDAKLSESDTISAGQRQLLTIARGMIDNAPFLILDEATSNVDTRTEELVQKAMDKLTEGKTSFIIAHRLSTIKNADLILVMKEGNIVEQGNHDELMAQNGSYAELYNSQFEL